MTKPSRAGAENWQGHCSLVELGSIPPEKGEEEVFFFEKEKQKTFVTFAESTVRVVPSDFAPYICDPIGKQRLRWNQPDPGTGR